MIQQLQINNFKAHKCLNMPTAGLNLLTGLNGMGKSSVIQALLLLRQSHLANALPQGLKLNGNLVEIGIAADAFNKLTETEATLDIKLSEQLYWNFRRNNGDFLPIQASQTIGIDECGLFNNNFQYLSAERLSPREEHRTNTFAVEINRQLSEHKGQGEYAVHFLSHYAQIQVHPLLCHRNARDNSLIKQVDAWMSEISPGIKTVIEDNLQNVKLAYQYDNGIDYTDPFKPENVGFGVSYALPIVVATLAAPVDSLLLFENPESHIHPAGQAKLAELFALAAQTGVQLFIETHSDHIINGTLVSIKNHLEGKDGVGPDNVRIYYFRRSSQSAYDTECVPVVIRSDGRIKTPPTGFFDQFAQDLRFLMRSRNG